MSSQLENGTYPFIQFQAQVGGMNTPNHGFPRVSAQKGMSFSIGRAWRDSSLSWVRQLGDVRTGWIVGWTDFGNRDNAGFAFSVLPSLEMGIGPKSHWALLMGMGGSYIDRKYHVVDNPSNMANSTDLNWTFRSFGYRNFILKEGVQCKLGIGFAHHSNGHTRLPNQGYNSFLFAMGLSMSKAPKRYSHNSVLRDKFVENQMNHRVGLGINSLSLQFNEMRSVHDVDISYSWIYNKSFRLGIGMYARHYSHYMRLLKSDEPLVIEDYQALSQRPALNASSLGVDVELELIMGHVGAELDLGVNIFKPAYELDWKLNEGHFEEEEYQYGELTWYYHVKHLVSSRLALNYYWNHMEEAWTWNPYFSSSLQANLGQADFTSFSIGVVRRW